MIIRFYSSNFIVQCHDIVIWCINIYREGGTQRFGTFAACSHSSPPHQPAQGTETVAGNQHNMQHAIAQNSYSFLFVAAARALIWFQQACLVLCIPIERSFCVVRWSCYHASYLYLSNNRFLNMCHDSTFFFKYHRD